MTWNLWLDDLREPDFYLRRDETGVIRERKFRRYAPLLSSDFIWCKSSLEAEEMVKELGPPKFMALDHDLGYTDTTMSFLRWLEKEHSNNPPEWKCHSDNPNGCDNMDAFMDSWHRSLKLP